jgi:hypothetical protein
MGIKCRLEASVQVKNSDYRESNHGDLTHSLFNFVTEFLIIYHRVIYPALNRAYN